MPLGEAQPAASGRGRGPHAEPLLLGKLALDHVPLIEELLERELLKPAWLRPRWMELPEADERMQRVYEGMDVHDLVKEVVAA